MMRFLETRGPSVSLACTLKSGISIDRNGTLISSTLFMRTEPPTENFRPSGLCPSYSIPA
ncbi:hypothetical protein I7I50_00143 [Histoplasma capsulatum G186AR]|uniref:Uncharacterized protein n=1 Tax=Ajellomyces capsulatus TaxID=5037 RepID=A0A8H8CUP4_AJECA|nr:hypothetical protein I7I52_07412 [Histoplasma capsulatum]QSS72331.1 hypothetical protein I7I50_00143 [Histoplasma capsulatum G186AR]